MSTLTKPSKNKRYVGRNKISTAMILKTIAMIACLSVVKGMDDSVPSTTAKLRHGSSDSRALQFLGGGSVPDLSSAFSDVSNTLSDFWCSIFPSTCSNRGPLCPVVKPLSAQAFDINRYIEKSWFIQQQQVVPYQSRDQLYCVVATYNKADNSSTYIDVNNYGNNNRVNGESQNSNEGFFGEIGELCAQQKAGGELQVGPCILSWVFDFVAGPYWVIAVADDYSWAIVSGGAPDQVYQTSPTVKCSTKEGSSFLDNNGSGLWLFTKKRVASSATIATMYAKLDELGIYTGLLNNVTQVGCNYTGAFLKE